MTDLARPDSRARAPEERRDVVDDGEVPLDPRIPDALTRVESYPAEADAIDPPVHIQTHLSHVFLTRSRVYKLRKSVRFDFVDFGTRTRRDEDCVNEIRLNRRLAPDVYLGLAPVWLESSTVRVGPLRQDLATASPEGLPVREHCVVMRRLPDGADALSLLERDSLTRGALTRLADRIACFHREHRLVLDERPGQWRQQIEAPVRDNLKTLRATGLDGSDLARLQSIASRTEAWMQRSGTLLEERFTRGLPVDGHGDLHLQHVWLPEPEGPAVVMDCLEFQSELRRLDPACDVAFLAMDLGYRGRRDLADHFLAAYASAADDYGLFDVVDYFISYRAAVRAKVARLAARDAAVSAQQQEQSRLSASRHLTFADQALAARPIGRLVAVTGSIGTGKTTVARSVGEALGGVVLSSDRVRKRLAGLEPLERARAGWGGSIYGEEMSDRTYAGLLERAAPALRSGRPVVLDATYASRERRDALRRWARAWNLRPLLIEVHCDPAQIEARLRGRTARGDDASDAGPELQTESARRYEAPNEWPAGHRIRVDTDHEDWEAELRAALRAARHTPVATG